MACVSNENVFFNSSHLSHSLFQTAARVKMRLDRNLRLCGENETDTDCCPKPLCVLETLQVSACVGGTPQASLLIQAKIHALLFPENTGSGILNSTFVSSSWVIGKTPFLTNINQSISDNETATPNHLYQTLGSCPCDLTLTACDVRCCCDPVFTSVALFQSKAGKSVFIMHSSKIVFPSFHS